MIGIDVVYVVYDLKASDTSIISKTMLYLVIILVVTALGTKDCNWSRA